MAEVDTDARSLCRTERELLRLAEGCGIARAEAIDRLFGRELDPDWIGEATSLSNRGWCALMQTHAQRLVELRADFEAVARRLGLPLSELRLALPRSTMRGESRSGCARRWCVRISVSWLPSPRSIEVTAHWSFPILSRKAISVSYVQSRSTTIGMASSSRLMPFGGSGSRSRAP